LAVITSMPELAVSITGAMSGHYGVVIGNAIGSNIANIALVLGLVAIIKPIKIESGSVKTFLGILFLGASSAIMVYAISFGGIGLAGRVGMIITKTEGMILIGLFVLYIVTSYFIKSGELKSTEGSVFLNSIMIVLGVAFVVLTAKVSVDALLRIAIHYNFSEVMVGATLIAFGTSLPELAVCLVLVLREEGDLLFGNLVASNVFDATFALGAAAMITTIAVPAVAASIHIPAMLFMNVVVMFLLIKEGIGRGGGIVLLVLYAIYTVISISGGFGLL